ncbi:hypothetical protein [Streptococcus sp. DD13]|uniref:hypothetical protein n=1 Tax=Streptococcus sp. DD13 TaxID=1777881 RepID=UPI0012E8223C|nr:hypothetical protein [Streptococcus sp. DD13]
MVMVNQKVSKIIAYVMIVVVFVLPFVVFAFFVEFRLFALIPPAILISLFYNGVRVKGEEQAVEFHYLEETKD